MAKDRAKGKKLKEIKKEASVRLFNQAYKQQGCLTNAEVAIMLKIALATVSKFFVIKSPKTTIQKFCILRSYFLI